MRAEHGQSSLEYAALLALALAVSAAGSLVLPGTGIARSVVAQMQRAICLVTGGECGERERAPCVTRSQTRSKDGSVRIAFVRLGGGATQLREHRSDGSVVLTVVTRGAAGLEASAGVKLGLGGHTLGGSVGGLVEGRVGRGRVWRLRSEAEADALQRSLSAGAPRAAPRAAGLGLRAAAPVPEPDERFGEHGLGSELRARLGRVGIELAAEDLVGSRTVPSSGTRTLTVRRRNDLSVSAALGGAGGDAGVMGEQRYGLTVDGADRPVDLVIVETLRIEGGGRVPAPLIAALGSKGMAKARGGRLALVERHLDLRDGANLAAAASFIRALRGPSLGAGEAQAASRALGRRLELAGSARALLYEVDTVRKGAEAQVSLGVGAGVKAQSTSQTLRLVAASARAPGVTWRERADCLSAAA